ncbi:MAG: sporulation integral membrane protein YlbJ [Clostridia bacterium]|nr:sporulation integral membrane protein YlbJ [Clostridia bacterium]
MFIPLFICLFTMFLLIFSNSNLSSAKTGLTLWANSVVPSLLPFFIATELLGYTNIISLLGKSLTKFMKPIFNVPGEGAFPFIMGIISGYPMGAKIVSTFKEQSICTNDECERLIAFTNNSGPLFIIGTIGVGLFKDAKIGFLLFLTHILACITVGFLFRWWKSNKRKRTSCINVNNKNFQSKISLSNLGEILAFSIMNSINTILLIGGFIVLFSVVISILDDSKILQFFANSISPVLNVFNIPNKFAEGILTGLIEVTNGVCSVSAISNKYISTNIIICAFLLGFGGISITLQILSITSKSEISIKPYIFGKLLQGVFAAFYTYLIIYNFPLFNLNL